MPSLNLENSVVDERYEVRRRLNHGSYAEIYEAFDLAEDRTPVIIKALNTSLQGTPDPELEHTLVENFQNEAIALDTVRHPNVVQRLGHGTAADLSGVPFHYLVLEYMEGGDLLALCRKQPLSLEKTVALFRQVAEALAEGHTRGVIHRDIKPNNLLLSTDQTTVKITDFGVAKLYSGDPGEEVTRVGTDMYAPPEHSPGSGSGITGALREPLTPSADIYSLAKTIYTAMTGRGPREFSRKPIDSLPPALASKPWGAQLLKILRKATADRSQDRYQSVTAFWNDFAELPTWADENESESETTHVRSRAGLRHSAPLPPIAPTPDFEPNLAAQREAPSARIVVELPEPAPKATPAPPPQAKKASQVLPDAPAQSSKASQPSPEVLTKPGLPTTRPRSASPERGDYSYLEDLHDLLGTGWRFRAFVLAIVLLLFASVAGVYLEVRRYVRNQQLPQGTVSSERAANLRNQPAGDIVGALPKGTRVRILGQDKPDNRSGWYEIEVIDLGGPVEREQPDHGWVLKQAVNRD